MDSSDARMHTKNTTQRSALKTSLTSENYLSRFTSQESSRKSTLLPPNYECTILLTQLTLGIFWRLVRKANSTLYST